MARFNTDKNEIANNKIQDYPTFILYKKNQKDKPVESKISTYYELK